LDILAPNESVLAAIEEILGAAVVIAIALLATRWTCATTRQAAVA